MVVGGNAMPGTVDTWEQSPLFMCLRGERNGPRGSHKWKKGNWTPVTCVSQIHKSQMQDICNHSSTFLKRKIFFIANLQWHYK